jgi:hypothetical protein
VHESVSYLPNARNRTELTKVKDGLLPNVIVKEGTIALEGPALENQAVLIGRGEPLECVKLQPEEDVVLSS